MPSGGFLDEVDLQACSAQNRAVPVGAIARLAMDRMNRDGSHDSPYHLLYRHPVQIRMHRQTHHAFGHSADARAAANVDEMPHAGTFSDSVADIDDGGLMLVVGHGWGASGALPPRFDTVSKRFGTVQSVNAIIHHEIQPSQESSATGSVILKNSTNSICYRQSGIP